MRTLIVVGLGAIALMGTGCSGSDSGDDTRDPEDAMLTLIGYYEKGQYGRAWEMLLPEHQRVVSRSDFEECMSERSLNIPAEARIQVEEVNDETLEVEPLGEIPTKAITWRVTAGGASASETSDLVERDGAWKWILTNAEYEAFQNGECPTS